MSDNFVYLGVISLGMIILIMFIAFYPPSHINTPLSTEQRKELCILKNELKYPTAANYTINRLCYLEELGRSLTN